MRPVNPLLFPTVKIESSLGKIQTREIRRVLESEEMHATFQDNFAAIDKHNRDDPQGDLRLAAVLWTEKPFSLVNNQRSDIFIGNIIRIN